MYHSGFTVDDGPCRLLLDPSNSEFLTSLARGMASRELQQDSGDGEVMVGRVDKRGEEYDPEKHRRQSDVASGGGDEFQSFSGKGQSLGASTVFRKTGGVIDPTHPNNMLSPPPVESSKPTTSIAIRLPNEERLVVKLNTCDSVSAIGQHIGQCVEGRYVLTSRYPPRTVENLDEHVEAAWLKGAQVGVKLV
jgi:hypothetical protein